MTNLGTSYNLSFIIVIILVLMIIFLKFGSENE